MEIAVIVVALVLGLLVLKFISGMVKFAVLAALAIGALYFAGVLG